jgi:hypothetical protein
MRRATSLPTFETHGECAKAFIDDAVVSLRNGDSKAALHYLQLAAQHVESAERRLQSMERQRSSA